MGIADVRVLADLQLHGPRLRARERDAGRLGDAGSHEMEVVDRRLVTDADYIRSRLEFLDDLAGALERDREARTVGCYEDRRLRRRLSSRNHSGRSDSERGERELDAGHLSPCSSDSLPWRVRRIVASFRARHRPEQRAST